MQWKGFKSFKQWRVPKDTVWSQWFKKPVQLTGTEGEIDKIENTVERGREVEIHNPTSQRWAVKGMTGEHVGGDISMDPYSGGTQYGRPSTAVADVKYDPNSHICQVKFVGGDKYYDYQMSEAEFNTFMKSFSKGRYVNFVMKYQNRMPGYPLKK